MELTHECLDPSENINNAIIIIIHRVCLGTTHRIHRNMDSLEHFQYMYMCSTDTFHRKSSKIFQRSQIIAFESFSL